MLQEAHSSRALHAVPPQRRGGSSPARRRASRGLCTTRQQAVPSRSARPRPKPSPRVVEAALEYVCVRRAIVRSGVDLRSGLGWYTVRRPGGRSFALMISTMH